MDLPDEEEEEANQRILREAERMGVEPPNFSRNKAPELYPGLQVYIDAFFDLDTERFHGNGLMPIPWSSIKTYADYWGFDEQQTSDLIFYIRFMDRKHLKRLAEKQTSQNENAA